MQYDQCYPIDSDPYALSKGDLKQIRTPTRQEVCQGKWWTRKAYTIGHIRILGIELDLAWSGGSCGGIHLHMKKFPRKSLHFMLDPVQYREYEYGLFFGAFASPFRVIKSLAFRPVFIPLTPKSDQCLISPNSNTDQLNLKVVRKKEVIK